MPRFLKTIFLFGVFSSFSVGSIITFPPHAVPIMEITPFPNPTEPPEFTLETLSGEYLRLSDYRGKVILIYFWATWCLPCKQEMIAIKDLRIQFQKKNLEILAVSADRLGKKNLILYAEKLNLNFPILLDPKGEVRNDYEVFALPMTYWIGKDGKTVARITGEKKWEGPEIQQFIQQLLDQSF